MSETPIKITIECKNKKEAMIIINAFELEKALIDFLNDYIMEAGERANDLKLGREPAMLAAKNKFKSYFKGMGIFLT